MVHLLSDPNAQTTHSKFKKCTDNHQLETTQNQFCLVQCIAPGIRPNLAKSISYAPIVKINIDNLNPINDK
jgi:hypothetical protein